MAIINMINILNEISPSHKKSKDFYYVSKERKLYYIDSNDRSFKEVHYRKPEKHDKFKADDDLQTLLNTKINSTFERRKLSKSMEAASKAKSSSSKLENVMIDDKELSQYIVMPKNMKASYKYQDSVEAGFDYQIFDDASSFTGSTSNESSLSDSTNDDKITGRREVDQNFKHDDIYPQEGMQEEMNNPMKYPRTKDIQQKLQTLKATNQKNSEPEITEGDKKLPSSP